MRGRGGWGVVETAGGTWRGRSRCPGPSVWLLGGSSRGLDLLRPFLGARVSPSGRALAGGVFGDGETRAAADAASHPCARRPCPARRGAGRQARSLCSRAGSVWASCACPLPSSGSKRVRPWRLPHTRGDGGVCALPPLSARPLPQGSCRWRRSLVGAGKPAAPSKPPVQASWSFLGQLQGGPVTDPRRRWPPTDPRRR